MKLQRVQVPDFRVLKNVDISFEKDFVPNIFPLGSQNGGGKSTLLQLIFVLLHCSGDSDKHEFIKNMLYGFEIDDSGKGILAAIDIWDGEKTVNLEFVVYKQIASHRNLLPKNNKPLIKISDTVFCRIDKMDIDKAEDFLNNLSSNIFLAAPATQVFLFLNKDSRDFIFKHKNNDYSNNYYSQLKQSQYKLSGFFTYDFLAVDLLIDIFKLARDKDFKKAIETGEYGNNYQQLINDLNQILLNKKININLDLSGFTFKLDKPGWGDIELYPEDLSHGELKRLSIYAWIKYNIMEDSIVLIDEIENGFHPDWQYQIIKDIAEWAPENQYIISTHSYELCQAVTPAHVKELEPRLISQESES